MPEARLPPLLRGRVIRLQRQGPIVRIERFPVPLQLLERDPFAGPRICAPIVLRDRLLVPQQGHSGIAAFEGELGELQQDIRFFLVRLNRLDEGLKVRIGGARLRRRRRFLFNLLEGFHERMKIGGDRGLVGLVLIRLLFFVVRDFQLRRRGLQGKLELGLGLRTRGDARLFPRRVDRWMLRIEALRSLQRIPRRLRVPEAALFWEACPTFSATVSAPRAPNVPAIALST